MKMKLYKSVNEIEERKLEDSQYYIYVIENNAGHIKVGISKNVNQRLISLSGSNTGGNLITRIAVSSPTYLKSLEKTIHTHYSINRIKGTEWFKNISFEEVVEFVTNLFLSVSYIKCNELRKQAGGYFNKRVLISKMEELRYEDSR